MQYELQNPEKRMASYDGSLDDSRDTTAESVTAVATVNAAVNAMGGVAHLKR